MQSRCEGNPLGFFGELRDSLRMELEAVTAGDFGGSGGFPSGFTSRDILLDKLTEMKSKIKVSDATLKALENEQGGFVLNVERKREIDGKKRQVGKKLEGLFDWRLNCYPF
jgi:hypothetical protein